MRRALVVPVSLLLPIVAACAHGTHGAGGSGGAGTVAVTGGNATGGTPTTTAGNGVTTGSVAPMTCGGTNGTKGCCVGSVLYYCPMTSMTVKNKDCSAMSLACGWDATKSYYGCVSPPSSADPSGKVPIQCGP